MSFRYFLLAGPVSRGTVNSYDRNIFCLVLMVILHLNTISVSHPEIH
jgi:hypothetical protein